jgi:hypothetical protein
LPHFSSIARAPSNDSAEVGGNLSSQGNGRHASMISLECEVMPATLASALRLAGRDLGDAADLEAHIGALDPPQRAELIDPLDEFAQILVHHRSSLGVFARVACERAQDVRRRDLW